MKRIEVTDSIMIDWMYPEIYGAEKPKSVLNIALYHTRAANDIEIEYDSEKDGWEIYQTIPIGNFKRRSDNIYSQDQKRKLIAFIPAWDEEYSFSEEYDE